jgi:hypothetical protein
MPSEFGEFVEAEDAMMGQRHLARHGHLAAADQSHIGNGLVGGATRPGGDEGGAPPGAAGDAREAGGFEGLSQGHAGENGGEAARQPRCAGPGGRRSSEVWSDRLH